VAHGDARWFALNRELKVPTAACGVSGAHGSASVAVDTAEYRLDAGTMHQPATAMYLVTDMDAAIEAARAAGAGVKVNSKRPAG
jgi:hypothetical protein